MTKKKNKDIKQNTTFFNNDNNLGTSVAAGANVFNKYRRLIYKQNINIVTRNCFPSQ